MYSGEFNTVLVLYNKAICVCLWAFVFGSSYKRPAADRVIGSARKEQLAFVPYWGWEKSTQNLPKANLLTPQKHLPKNPRWLADKGRRLRLLQN